MSRYLFPISKNLIVCVIIFILSGVLFFVAWLSSGKNIALSPKPQYLGVPEQRQRIDGFIKQLTTELLEDSIRQLLYGGTDQFYYPGTLESSSLKFYEDNFEEMLSNRRSIKILDEIRVMPPQKREEFCKSLFERALAIHKKVFDDVFVSLTEGSDDTVSLQSTRNLLCVSLFASAEFTALKTFNEEVVILRKFYEDVVAALKICVSNSQLEQVIADNYTQGGSGSLMPDNRFLVNVMVIALKKVYNENDISLMLSKIMPEYRTKDILIVPCNADTTAFDIPVYMEGVLVDLSKGSRTLRLLEWPNAWAILQYYRERNVITQLEKILNELR
ncbi:MAG: hypothetical protein LBP59_19550 [Planctomycetaceae bacterium]|jgi:hypothetical protein|nr:hypothetical protein [Planctomycetaceae bacterium]